MYPFICGIALTGLVSFGLAAATASKADTSIYAVGAWYQTYASPVPQAHYKSVIKIVIAKNAGDGHEGHHARPTYNHKADKVPVLRQKRVGPAAGKRQVHASGYRW